MEAFETTSDAQLGASRAPGLRALRIRSIPDRVLYTLYGLTLAVAVSVWFIAIRAPLWLDETVSMFLIRGGIAGIMSRQVWPDAPAYSCMLWLWTKAVGTSEIALRISSIPPMLGAVYLLYRSARELWSRDVAIITAVVFCLHPIIVFAAIDVRPYSFAALAVTSSIYILVRLRNNNSTWLAALFGLSAACIVYLQLLFAVLLPALAISFVALKIGDRKLLRRQLGVALAVFAVAFVPVIPRLEYMVHTSGTHVFAEVPTLVELASTLTLRKMVYILIAAILVAAATRRLNMRSDRDTWPILLCTSLALIPILTLYGLSVETSIHVFVPRYRLVAVPGIALCWGLVVSRIDSRALRLLFCLVLVTASAFRYYSSPIFRHHQYTWKYALDFVEKNASADNARVLICSDIPEADHMRMPVGAAIEDSGILPPLSYYKLSVPVVPLPRALNEEAVRSGSEFLRQAAQTHQRFLAVAFAPSYGTLDWLANNSAGTHRVRELENLDGVKVLEFVPR